MKKFRLKNFSSLTIDAPKFNRAEHMRNLHQSGRYMGTSKIGAWNVSDEKRQRMAEIRSRNLLDKNARGYGSEHAMRVNNKNLLFNKFQGERGFLYVLRFPGSIKVGYSKDWERRTSRQILGGTVIAIVSGTTQELANLEYDVFETFQEYAQLDSTKTRYTEFLDIKVKKDVFKFIKDQVKNNKNLKFEVLYENML